MAFLASDNHACTQKTDASHDALNHTAGVGGGYRMDRQNCQGRAETQDAEGAYASRLPMQIAVKPEQSPTRVAAPSRSAMSRVSIAGKNLKAIRILGSDVLEVVFAVVPEGDPFSALDQIGSQPCDRKNSTLMPVFSSSAIRCSPMSAN